MSRMITRDTLEKYEDQTLAPFGFRSMNSKGRAYRDKEPQYRTVFQRDRDRIIHTTAFRRLEYKTQVFVITEGDYYRTRLTHTLEVAQIGRTIARAMGANEDLVESICLAHDLGHPPFGHAGETALNQLMDGQGGFDHNKQSYRIVTGLEKRFPDHPGLNLTWEVREGIVKHETEYDRSDAAEYEPDKLGPIEAQIANIADELAYTAHDLDDGLRSALFRPADLTGLRIRKVMQRHLTLDEDQPDDLMRHRLIRKLIGLEVTDVLHESSRYIDENGIDSVEAVQRHPENAMRHSDEFSEMNRELKDFLFERMYQHHRVYRMQVKAESILQDLFQAYIENPKILPGEVLERLDDRSFPRIICDYIAGMTDRFAISEHSRLFDPQVRP